MSDENTIEDTEADELDFAPENEPKSSKTWLSRLTDAERAMSKYNHVADGVDKLYADLDKLSNGWRDPEFQVFWANIGVMGPSIYARQPKPVVVPRYKDRRPLFRVTSELLERTCDTGFELTDAGKVMRMIRDDLAINARGVAWARYETKQESDSPTERVCIDFKHRKDFLHEPARNWLEVGWVAGASYMSRQQMRKRFRKFSGDAYQDADYKVLREEKANGAAGKSQKCKVWEIWSKTHNKVFWVAPGCDTILDEGEPHLKLSKFFPCPEPAFATTQRYSLVPVPDVVYYKDQLDGINEMTRRIHALAHALKVKGFYAGGGEIGEAVEAAMAINDDGKIMVPVANWAAFGGQAGGTPIVWLPIDVIAKTILECVNIRKQLISDVYEISGLSDIQRGETDPNETLGAQQLKQQNGAVRVRDKQSELVRLAKELVCIMAEIVAENFEPETMLEMSQLEIPTDADIRKQIQAAYAKGQQQLEQQAKQALQNPQAVQMAKSAPEKAQAALEQLKQQIEQQLQPEIQKLQDTPTIEKCVKLLRDQKMRPFALDIETDSTINPDEQAEKASRAEFMTAFAQSSQALMGVAMQGPAGAALAGEMLKFSLAPFRVGRMLEGAIDDFVDQMVQQAGQQKPNPEQEALQAKSQAEQEAHKANMAEKAQAAQLRQKESEAKQKAIADDDQRKANEAQIRLAQANQQHAVKMDEGRLNIALLNAKIAQASAPVAGGEGEGHKPPSESINFKDLPPEGQAQMAAQAGITLTPEAIEQHNEAQDAKKADEMALKASLSPKPAAKEPA